MQPEEQYLNDPVFHRLVQINFQAMLESGISPVELRNAATYAAIRFQALHCRHVFQFERPLDRLVDPANPFPGRDGPSEDAGVDDARL